MRIRVEDGLAFVSATIRYNDQSIELDNMLLDTGSVGTMLAIDQIEALNLSAEPGDTIYRVVGIGGAEYVFSKNVDLLSVGHLQVSSFTVEFGAMRYGFTLDGIVGLDFLLETGAVIDLMQLDIHQGISP